MLNVRSPRRQLQVSTVVLMARRSQKGHSLVTLGKPLHVYLCLPGDKDLSEYNKFSGKMVIKRPFLSDTGEASALHVPY